MQNDAITQEYRRRETIAGERHCNTIIFKRSKKIHSIHKQGLWAWSEFVNQQNINISKSIRSYIAEKKIITLKEAYEYAKTLISDINERSIKAYITKDCYKIASGQYVYKQCRREFPNEKFYIEPDQLLDELVDVLSPNMSYQTIQDIEDLYTNKYGLLAGKKLIYNICYDNPNLFEKKRAEYGRGKPVLIRLCPNFKDKLNELKNDKKNRPVRRRVQHTQNVINETINILQSKDDNCIDRTLLIKMLKPLLPKNQSATYLYKILKDSIFVDDGNTVRLNPEYFPVQMQPITDNASQIEVIDTNVNNGYNTNVRKLTDDDYEDIKNCLFEHISSHLEWLSRDNMAINDINNAWDKFVSICGVKNEGVNGAFQRTFRYLHKYLCGAITLDEKFSLYDELNRRFEEYLSNITHDKEESLKMQIDTVESLGILPSKYQKCCLTKYISNLIYYRNGPAHKNGKTPLDSYMTNAIYQAMVLYLYTADQCLLKEKV